MSSMGHGGRRAFGPGFLVVRALVAALAVSVVPGRCAASDAHSVRWRLVNGVGTGDAGWFDQKLDHFSPTDQRSFRQRFFEVTQFAKGPNHPVLLYICGEAPCGGVPGGFVLKLAEDFGAAAVSLEHRYYGDSMPFADVSTEHMAYLSTKQALADLAFFRQYYQATLCKRALQAGGSPDDCGANKWLVVGGSYSGALSAWLRLKYPHLFHASLASSAVVDVILDFYQFDLQVYESAGPLCGPILQQVTRAIESRLQMDNRQTKALFQAEALADDRDFLFLVADAAVFGFQYGRPDAVCLPLIAAKEKGEDLVLTFADYTVNVLYKYFGVLPSDYDQEALKNATITPRSAARVWFFQCCTEMAYFQTAPAENSVRSKAIDMQYWRDFCSNVYGPGIFPDTAATNTFYGSTSIAGSKIIFSNGSQDPWQRASKLTPSLGEPSVIVNCHNCGHCVDMRGCPPNTTSSSNSVEGSADACTNPAAVRKARKLIKKTLEKWLFDGDGMQQSQLAKPVQSM